MHKKLKTQKEKVIISGKTYGDYDTDVVIKGSSDYGSLTDFFISTIKNFFDVGYTREQFDFFNFNFFLLIKSKPYSFDDILGFLTFSGDEYLQNYFLLKNGMQSASTDIVVGSDDSILNVQRKEGDKIISIWNVNSSYLAKNPFVTGIGTILLIKFFQYVAEANPEGLLPIELLVLIDNSRAQHVYEKIGFKFVMNMVTRDKAIYKSTSSSQFFYRMRLDSTFFTTEVSKLSLKMSYPFQEQFRSYLTIADELQRKVNISIPFIDKTKYNVFLIIMDWKKRGIIKERELRYILQRMATITKPDELTLLYNELNEELQIESRLSSEGEEGEEEEEGEEGEEGEDSDSTISTVNSEDMDNEFYFHSFEDLDAGLNIYDEDLGAGLDENFNIYDEYNFNIY